MGKFAFSAQTRQPKTIEQRVEEVKEKIKPPKRYVHKQGSMWTGTKKIRPWN